MCFIIEKHFLALLYIFIQKANAILTTYAKETVIVFSALFGLICRHKVVSLPSIGTDKINTLDSIKLMCLFLI